MVCQHGYVDEAVRHPLAGAAWPTAARLIEQQALLRFGRGELATLQQWLAQLPGEVIRDRPFLGRALVLALLFSGQFSAIETHLTDIEEALARAAAPADPSLERLPHAQGDGLYVGLGALQYERNELGAAEHALTTGIDLARQEGNTLVLAGGLLVLARVRQAQGETDAARTLLVEATGLLAQHPISWLWVKETCNESTDGEEAGHPPGGLAGGERRSAVHPILESPPRPAGR